MKKRIAVLRGGPSSEYEVSLKSGAGVIENLPQKFKSVDVFIDKAGVWHIEGIPIKPSDLQHRVDVVFNALHGKYGEDGTVQKILETFKIPFTGSGSLSSAIGMNKILSKKVLEQHGIKSPYHKEFNKNDEKDLEKLAHLLHTKFPQPSVIKPASAGSSVGVSVVHSFLEIEDALRKAFEHDDNILVEEFIRGKEATCGVLENFRGQDIYSLIPIEIVPKKSSKNPHNFFDFNSKYVDVADERCPGSFTRKESEEIQKLAADVHKAIGARHYSRTDFIVTPRRGIYVLEINTLPGLTPTSLMPKSMNAVGSSYAELLEHLINLAIQNK